MGFDDELSTEVIFNTAKQSTITWRVSINVMLMSCCGTWLLSSTNNHHQTLRSNKNTGNNYHHGNKGPGPSMNDNECPAPSINQQQQMPITAFSGQRPAPAHHRWQQPMITLNRQWRGSTSPRGYGNEGPASPSMNGVEHPQPLCENSDECPRPSSTNGDECPQPPLTNGD